MRRGGGGAEWGYSSHHTSLVNNAQTLVTPTHTHHSSTTPDDSEGNYVLDMGMEGKLSSVETERPHHPLAFQGPPHPTILAPEVGKTQHIIALVFFLQLNIF